MNSRCRFGQGANYTPMVTVSGYGNSFHNIYTMWGADDSGNLVGWHNTGSRNKFQNMHFAGPMNAAQAIDTSACFHNAGEEAYFENCVFGTDTVDRAAGATSLLLSGIQRSIFKDCTFLAGSDAGLDAYLIEAASTAYGWAYFDNCKFINISTTGFGNTMAEALACGATTTAFRFLFSAGTVFHGVTDVIAAADEANVEFGRTATGIDQITGDLQPVMLGLPANPDAAS
jgi:hypothetical protein